MITASQNAWRWDQGRLSYFLPNNVRRMAHAFVELEGVELNSHEDTLRSLLTSITSLPFKPENYKVWRNYARVFKILGLASSVNDKLIPTALCKKMAASGDSGLTHDEYIQYIARVFYYPSPVFENYHPEAQKVFPFCAVLKYLIAKSYTSGDPVITTDDVFNFIIGNNVTGTEEIPAYQKLPETRSDAQNTELRQVREMLIFFSHLSYLFWHENKLFLDSSAISGLTDEKIRCLTSPIIRTQHENPDVEIQNMYDIETLEKLIVELNDSTTEDLIFTEGKKIRRIHLRTERNRKVVRYYFENAQNPRLCDICQTEVADRYPWLNNLIEVHHILPLASPIRVEMSGTSLNDLVGLCPNCHRATHAFYRGELTSQNITDFRSDDHAKEVYLKVKSQYISL